MMNHKNIAVFDFDKTITDRHTFWRFLKFSSGSLKFSFATIILLPDIYKYLTKKTTLMVLREKVIYYFLKGISYKKFLDLCKQFSEKHILYWISNDAIQRLKWHQEEGHYTILLSNSPEEYLAIIAEKFGFDSILGSRFEFTNNKATGKLTGDHCYGKEKVNRLKKSLGNLSDYYIYAYGDSEGDKELLEIANMPHYRFFDLKIKYIKNGKNRT